MTDRPCLIYPPTGTSVPGHPLPPPVTSPTAPAVPGDTAVAPVVTYSDPDPLPASTPGTSQPGILRPRSLTALLALLAMILAALLLAATWHSSQPAAAPGRPALPGVIPARHGNGLGPITLPSPEGNATRTVPLDTIWIVDKTLPKADLTTISQEAPADIAYLTRFSIPGDRLGFTLQPQALEPIRTHAAGLAAMVSHPAGILIAEPGQPIHLPPVTPGHDRAIIIITTNPARWLDNMPTGPTPPRPTSQARPGQSRTYILDLKPGSGPRADPLTPSRTQPQQLTADPRVHGGLARALARAFVDATGATWPA